MSGKTTVQARDPNKLNSGYFQSHDTAARPVHFKFGSACSTWTQFMDCCSLTSNSK